MKALLSAAALLALAAPAFAGDVAVGEKEFGKCKSCHMIVADDGTEIVKGGKVGPNLYGVVGRVAGSVDGYSYGDGLKAAQAASVVWTEAEIAAFITDPKAWLDGKGHPTKSKMSFKAKAKQEDLAAYLASVKPAQ